MGETVRVITWPSRTSENEDLGLVSWSTNVLELLTSFRCATLNRELDIPFRVIPLRRLID
jgi:hypothetical protein